LSTFRRSRALNAEDDFSTFDCGEPSLNEWLRSRALKNEATGASRTFVSVDESRAVAGYYCLSANSLSREEVAGKLGRNVPTPIPVILIGRLAVDERFKGGGLGASLLQDAIAKGVEAAHLVGARAFAVDALNDSAEAFYAKFGFAHMPATSRRAMYLLTADAEATIASIDS